MAINKEIDLRFVFGYTPLEFHDTLRNIAEGNIDVRPLITGTVGLNGVGQKAVNALAAQYRAQAVREGRPLHVLNAYSDSRFPELAQEVAGRTP